MEIMAASIIVAAIVSLVSFGLGLLTGWKLFAYVMSEKSKEIPELRTGLDAWIESMGKK
jgi:hypothetical protein